MAPARELGRSGRHGSSCADRGANLAGSTAVEIQILNVRDRQGPVMSER